MSSIKLRFGDATEDLLGFLTRSLSDDEVDEIEVERVMAKSVGLASEPTTVAAVVTLSSVVAISLCRLIERYFEERRQLRQMELVLEAYGVSVEAGREIAELAKRHANIVATFGELPKPKSGL